MTLPAEEDVQGDLGTIVGISDSTESVLSMPQKHEAFATSNDAENEAPSLPAHLLGVSLYEVAGKGDVEAVRELINAKVDVNAQGEKYGNALQVASYKGHKAVVQLLLEEGAEVNAEGGYFGNAL